MANSAVTFEWDEVEEFGTPLYKLRPGDWFAVVLADQEGLRMETVTGKLVYPGIGSALVELDRSWESRIRWAPETKVIPLPKPKPEPRRVSLNPATFTDEE